MEKRRLGKTNFDISSISLGTWQLGGGWGATFDPENADRLLAEATDAGINFFDTADVYSGGASEQAVGKFIRSRSERLYLATKCGRKLQPHNSETYTTKALRKFVEDSLKNTGLDTLDLIQLHCPPSEVYYRPEIFGLFDRLKEEGKILNLGVSVAKVEEALKAIEFENVTTVQIIFNLFRLRPAKLFFKEAKKRDVGIIVRVPLASGLLAGKYDKNTEFEAGDHRNFNREGEAFDKGETFSGVPYEVGLKAVSAIREIFPGRENLAPTALRWILSFQEVSCIIPGASKIKHVHSNLSALELPPLTESQQYRLKGIYESMIRPHVHHLW